MHPDGAHEIDFLVIGGGPGGYAAALHAAHLGRRVVLLERKGPQRLGGVCLHSGCIPTKALLLLADRARAGEELHAAGLRGGAGQVDLAAFQQWRRGLVGRLAKGVGALLHSAGVEVRTGMARFVSPQAVEVTGPEGRSRVQFTDALLATGSRPLSPPGLPVDGDTVLDSSMALALESIPATLLLVGGGSVGMELGTIFAKLGSRVTIVEQAGELLPMIDPSLVRPLRRRLRAMGVTVHTSAVVADHARGRALVRTASGEVEVDAERVLAGVGRRPNTDDLALGAAGLAADPQGFLHPAPDRRVARHIAAIGDITPGPFHAHRSMAEADVAVQALCGRPARFEPRALPFIAHADPEIASAGLTASAAQRRGLPVTVTTFPLRASGWAVALGQPEGFAQLVTHAETDVVLGVHLVGPGATELIGEAALAVETRATAAQLRRVVHAHPTLSEQLGEAAHLAGGTPVNVPLPAPTAHR